MDLRFMAIVMAIAVIMDVLGRMARKRAAEQQQSQVPPEEGWNVLEALADADEPANKLPGEELPPARTRWLADETPDVEPAARVDAPRPAPPPADPGAWPDPARASERTAPEPAVREPFGVVPAVAPAALREDPVPWETSRREPTPRPIEVRSRAPRTFDPERRLAPPEPETERRPHPPGGDVGTVSRRSRVTGLGGRMGLTDVRALRNIVVAREVLGPPLALRNDDKECGGHGS